MTISLITTLGGALFGGIQNYLEHKQDSKKETDIAKINADKEIELAKQGVEISQNELETQESEESQEQSKTESSLKESDASEYKAFAEAVTQTSGLWSDSSTFAKIANFITCTTRPIITYILLALVFVVAMKIMKDGEVSENHLVIFDLILAEFSAVMSYWFVRRSFEKRQTPQLQFIKKKSEELTEEVMPKITAKSITKQNQIVIVSNDILLQKACDLIAKFEGYNLKAYQCPAKVWTIGYGHTKCVQEGQLITRENAIQYLKEDTKDFLDFVCKEVGKICNENQVIALTSFAFNLGVKNLRKSTLLKVIKINPNDFNGIHSEFMRWVYADGKVLNGLKTRRSEESDLYKTQSIS